MTSLNCDQPSGACSYGWDPESVWRQRYAIRVKDSGATVVLRLNVARMAEQERIRLANEDIRQRMR